MAAAMLLVASMAPAAPAAAQDVHPAAAEVIVVPRGERSPVIDGRLAEGEWSGAAVLDEWVQVQPGDNVAPSGATTLMLVHDDDALYLAIRARDPRGVRYAVHPRDRVTEQSQDWVGLLLDTFGHRRQAFGFALNPLGIQGDGILIEGGGVVEWDAIFQSEGRVDEDGQGYVIEVRIPFRSVRFRAAPVQRWGLSISREYGRTGATDSPWPLDRDRGCVLCQMRTIELAGVRPGRNLEVNPALVGGTASQRAELGEPLDPYAGRLEPGLNVKYGLGEITLDATLNPDFSQIESDAGQLEVNTRFAIFYPEKRPFFLEGADLFATGIAPPGGGPFTFVPVTLVHSRTIVAPDWGLKVSGKSGPVGIGAIVARDGAAREFDAVDVTRSDVVVARTSLDVLDDGRVGGVFTGRRHGGVEDITGGADARLRFGNLTLRGLMAGSRYGSGELDGEESGSGAAVHAQADWQSRHWVAGAAVFGVQSGFEAPLGFVPRSDYVTGTGAVSYIWQGTGLVHRIQPQLRYERTWDHADGRLLSTGRRIDELWEPSIGFTLDRAIGFGFGYHRAFIHHDDRSFSDMNRWGVFFNSATLDWLHISASVLWGEDVIFEDEPEDDGAGPGWFRSISLQGTLRPIPALRADLTLQSNRIWRRADDDPRSSLFADAMVPRLRLEYQATRRLGLRGIAEWWDTELFRAAGDATERDQRVQLEFLASYIIDAGSAFYIGWTELQRADLSFPMRPDRRGGVAKATYVWRF
jgi:hypothetical protein